MNMKFTKTLFAFLCTTAVFMASCSSDDQSNIDPGPNNPGELVLVAIDTAKVITMNGTGGDPVTALNRLTNSSSYFSGLSISPDGTKVAYGDYQTVTFSPDVVRTRQIRVVNTDGTGDHIAYEADDTSISFGAIKFCSDNKIFFVEETYWPDASRTLHVVNTDGTGLQTLPSQHNVADVTSDLAYFILKPTAGNNGPIVQIIDRSGDNGGGSLYHNETFAGIDEYSVGDGVFTADGELAVIPYEEGTELKARVINMESKTSTVITLVSGLSGGWLSYHLAMASDSNRGIITVTGEGYARSKTYVFNLSENTVAAPFENNDENVLNIYAY